LSFVAFLQNVPKDDLEKSQNLLHKLYIRYNRNPLCDQIAVCRRT